MSLTIPSSGPWRHAGYSEEKLPTHRSYLLDQGMALSQGGMLTFLSPQWGRGRAGKADKLSFEVSTSTRGAAEWGGSCPSQGEVSDPRATHLSYESTWKQKTDTVSTASPLHSVGPAQENNWRAAYILIILTSSMKLGDFIWPIQVVLLMRIIFLLNLFSSVTREFSTYENG